MKIFAAHSEPVPPRDLDVKTVIIGLLKSKSDRTRLETLAFLRDMLHGRPGQSVGISGGLIHAHTNWRPLAQLSDAEVELLDSITKKLTTPANASQDGPQNQIESKPAIEAEVVCQLTSPLLLLFRTWAARLLDSPDGL